VTLRDGTRPPPRYVQVAEALKGRIIGNEFPTGSFLPTEIELCLFYDVSRHTVREALRQLAEAGYVQRRQGSGSLVISADPKGTYVHSMRSLSELFQYAADTTLRIDRISERRPEADFGQDLGDLATQTWLTVEGLRLDATGRQPICWSTVFISRAFNGIAPELGAQPGAIYRLIEDRYGVHVDTVAQEIRCMPISVAAARELGVSRRLWVVRVVRRYLDAQGGVMVLSVNDHPGDRFSYSMQLRRDLRGRA